MSHTCHAYRCQTPCPPRMLMCRAHWFQVPKPLQDAVWAAYRPGQEEDKQPSAAWLLACTLAQNAVGLKEGAINQAQAAKLEQTARDRHERVLDPLPVMLEVERSDSRPEPGESPTGPRQTTLPYRQLREALYKHTEGRIGLGLFAEAFGITQAEVCYMERGDADPTPLHRLDIWLRLGATEAQVAWLARKIVAGLPAAARAVVEQHPRSPRAQDILLGIEQLVELGDGAAVARAMPDGSSCVLISPDQQFSLLATPEQMQALGLALISVSKIAQGFRAEDASKSA